MNLDRLNILARLSIESGIAKQIHFDEVIRSLARNGHVRHYFNKIKFIVCFFNHSCKLSFFFLSIVCFMNFIYRFFFKSCRPVTGIRIMDVLNLSGMRSVLVLINEKVRKVNLFRES